MDDATPLAAHRTAPDPAPGDGRLDRVAMLLSGLCVVHCLATSVVLGVMSAATGLLGEPIIHEIGLAIAIVLGAVALGRGVRRHGRRAPLALGAIGLAIMATALVLPHSLGGEAIATVVGVSILAGAHLLNRRGTA